MGLAGAVGIRIAVVVGEVADGVIAIGDAASNLRDIGL